MAKKDKSEKKATNSGGGVREQFAPFFKVVTGGVTVDYTDKLSEASTVFKEASAKPKFIYKIDFGGHVSCVNAQY
jgi:hypothetical protein